MESEDGIVSAPDLIRPELAVTRVPVEVEDLGGRYKIPGGPGESMIGRCPERDAQNLYTKSVEAAR